MSNAWLNWRFGSYHLQFLYDFPFIRFSYNHYHDVIRKTDETWKWFERY